MPTAGGLVRPQPPRQRTAGATQALPLGETCTKCTLKVTAPQLISYCMIYPLHGAGHVTLTLAIRNCDGSRLNGWRARRPS